MNSNITQPKFKPDKKKSEMLLYFKNLIEEHSSTTSGTCRVLGIRTKLFPAGRNLSVLSGSGTFVNFHHYFEEGLMLSKEALIRYYFLPLGCELLQGKVCVISSNNPYTAEMYVRDCCTRTFMAIGQNSSSSILKNESRTTSTAVFRFIDKLLSKYTHYDRKESISLYHFTNFGASPDLTIYTLPFQAFYFYVLSQQNNCRGQWNRFVAHHYKTFDLKGLKFDEQTISYIGLDQKEEKIVDEEQYKYWSNTIYDNLLKGRSILPQILFWCKSNAFNLQLFENYLILIQNMKNETINKLREIATFILQSTPDTEVKKVITNLNGINSAFLLRRFILKIVEKNYALGNESAIITVEDYINYLFPETRSWMETRDVLLIYIYQMLHERKIKVDIDDIEIADEFNDDVE